VVRFPDYLLHKEHIAQSRRQLLANAAVAALRHQMAAIGAEFGCRRRDQPNRGQIMKMLTSAQLFGAPKMTRKTKARLARAKLVIAAARDRAVETAQQRQAPAMKRFPTVLQRRRLAERLAQYGAQF